MQSLVIGGVLGLFGIVLVVLGVLADLLSVNRKLMEDLLLRVKRLEYGDAASPTRRRGRRPRAGPARVAAPAPRVLPSGCFAPRRLASMPRNRAQAA